MLIFFIHHYMPAWLKASQARDLLAADPNDAMAMLRTG
jgi:hypothetical protein